MPLRTAKVLAQGPLAHFVEHVRLLSDVPSTEPYVRLPDGRLELLLASSSGAYGGASLNVMGTRLTPLRKTSAAVPECIVVRFRAGGAYPFFGVPLNQLTDQVVPLDALLGKDCAPWKRALEAATPSARVAAVQHALLSRLATPSFEPSSVPIVRRALRELARTSTLPTVSRLAHDLDVSARHLRRAFAELVGVTPKEYLRIVRFQRALRMARAQPGEPWTRLAEAHGYYDQAHLVAEFRALAGDTPRALR